MIRARGFATRSRSRPRSRGPFTRRWSWVDSSSSRPAASTAMTTFRRGTWPGTRSPASSRSSSSPRPAASRWCPRTAASKSTRLNPAAVVKRARRSCPAWRGRGTGSPSSLTGTSSSSDAHGTGHDHFENLGSGASAAAGEEVPVGAQASQLGGELAAAGGMHAAEARWEPNASVEAHRWRSSGGEVGVYQCDAGGVLRAGLPGQGDAAQLEVRGGGSSGVRLELAPPGGAAGRGGGAGLEDFQVEQRGAGSPREAALPVVGSRCVLSLVRFAGRLGHASAAKVLAGRRWDKPAEAGVSSIN
ncbi:hypothetical protein SELMODRAFT_448261, partial [Selaginella moellendorffii]